jgi:hypothetical protein
MARFVPHILIACLCLLIWVLWQNNVYPFNATAFSFEGYGIHLIGGIGYTAVQVLLLQAVWTSFMFTSKFFTAQAVIAFCVLGAVEMLQAWDPTRTVQLGDLAAQTIGIFIALLLLRFFERMAQMPKA